MAWGLTELVVLQLQSLCRVWPGCLTPAAHGWLTQALAGTSEPRVATSLECTIDLNFKFMLVAFFSKYKDIAVLLFTQGMHVLKIWKIQIPLKKSEKKKEHHP